jgi:hypothetical protein
LPFSSTEKLYGGVPPVAAIVQPPYAVFCVPPGQLVVVILNGPPDEVRVTFAEAVTDPAALVAVIT